MENPTNTENQLSNTKHEMDPKVVSIVSYLTIVGWIVALVMNKPKSELGSFHIRQALGIHLLYIASTFVAVIPILGWIAALIGLIAAFVFWIIGLVAAVQGQQKSVPLLGSRFQEWFNTL